MKKYVILSFFLAGCSGAQIKKQVAGDLNTIVQQNADCPSFCAAVKAYIQTQLGK